MALEFTNSGYTKLQDRDDAYFEGGTPVNMPAWEAFKNLDKELMKNNYIQVEKHA